MMWALIAVSTALLVSWIWFIYRMREVDITYLSEKKLKKK